MMVKNWKASYNIKVPPYGESIKCKVLKAKQKLSKCRLVYTECFHNPILSLNHSLSLFALF